VFGKDGAEDVEISKHYETAIGTVAVGDARALRSPVYTGILIAVTNLGIMTAS
jgi:hypothetical protein